MVATHTHMQAASCYLMPPPYQLDDATDFYGYVERRFMRVMRRVYEVYMRYMRATSDECRG